MSRRLVSIAQAATHLGVGERTVANYIGKGYFPAYVIGGRRGHVVDLNEVDAAIAALPRTKARPKGRGRSFGPKSQIIMLPAQPEVVKRDEQS